MTDLFISYSRVNSEIALALAAQLRAEGSEVWIDQRDIPPSVPWMSEIQRVIRESELVVVLESPSWLGSPACQIELNLARESRIPVVWVDPDLSTAEQVALVLRAYRELPPWRAVVRDSARASAIWSGGGRRSALLMRGRPLAVMQAAVAEHPEEFSPTAVEFVRTSRQAASRRRTWRFFLGLIVPALLLPLTFTASLIAQVNERAQESVAASTRLAERDTYAFWSVYAGLERSPVDVSGSFLEYRQLFDFLTERTPLAWDPTPVNEIGATTALAPDGGQVASAEGTGVALTDADGLKTRLTAPAQVLSLAWSPDSRWLALATQSGATVISVESGSIVELRGGAGTTTTVRWSDERTVVVGGSAGSGTWRVFDWEPIAEVDSVRLGATIGSRHYTVDSAGVVSATDLVTGSTEVIFSNPPADSTATAMDAAGNIVVTAYSAAQGRLVIVDNTSGESREITLPTCSPLALSLSADASAAYLGCYEMDTNLTRVDLGTGETTSAPATHQVVLGVRVLGDGVIWGGQGGAVFRTELDLSSVEPVTYDAGCAAPIRKFVGAQSGQSLITVGDATGLMACATMIRLDRSDATVSRFILDPTDANAVPDAAVSPDGQLVAYGLADGRVWVFNIEDYAPVYFGQVAADQVRDIAFTADSRSVIVSSADGRIVSVPIPFTSLAQGAGELTEDARTRVQNAIDWGLYVSTVG